MVNFGTVLKKLRTQSGMSQRQLAEKLGVTKSTISYYELSERTPSPDIIIKIANIFHVSTDYLLGRDTKIALDVSDLPHEDVELVGSFVDVLRKKNQQNDITE